MLDAAQLKKPDRVPILLRMGHMLAELEGVSKQYLYENPAAAQAAVVRAALRFEPDAIVGLGGSPVPSRLLEDRSTRWPGCGMGPDGSFQYIEHEFMKPEDYDRFLADPSDWAIRVYLPRVFGKLGGLALLPPLAMAALGYYGLIRNLQELAKPELEDTFRALAAAAQAQADSIAQNRATAQQLEAAGFPPAPFLSGVLLEAPFDFMSDTLRAMRGIFLDIHRRPGKLLAAEEKVAAFQLEYALAAGRATGNPYVFFPLHRGSDEFMSLAQFERFYWPQLKRMFLVLIDAGMIPFVFYEGVWDRRLPYLAELPKGRTIGHFQNSDIFRVKEVLGGTMCIMGGMPNSLLVGGTIGQVREHTRKLCEVVGRDGGFLMTTGISDLQGSKPELVDAWMKATREFGIY